LRGRPPWVGTRRRTTQLGSGGRALSPSRHAGQEPGSLLGFRAAIMLPTPRTTTAAVTSFPRAIALPSIESVVTGGRQGRAGRVCDRSGFCLVGALPGGRRRRSPTALKPPPASLSLRAARIANSLAGRGCCRRPRRLPHGLHGVVRREDR